MFEAAQPRSVVVTGYLSPLTIRLVVDFFHNFPLLMVILNNQKQSHNHSGGSVLADSVLSYRWLFSLQSS